ncbi:MAG: tetraacyldisaccharide 4'-kinase [bacterium]|nr:tetraacyldisaccharide 4'-kinase [bacterium]
MTGFLLRLPALLFRGVVRLRNRHYDRPGATCAAALPVVSVGNLTVGGTGKTPVVAWIAERLQERGRVPAVVSRGYGGRAGAGPLVVSDGSGPSVAAEECGDEPFLLARSLPGARVVVGSDRVRGAAEALRLGADVVILDDGFQHRRLRRDLDLVLVDANAPFGNGRLLPAGLLREPPSSLSRADVILATRSEADRPLDALAAEVRKHNPTAPLLRAGHRGVGFFDAKGAAAERPARAVAFCGIGNPDAFRGDLERAGVALAGFHAFRDHHSFSTEEIARLLREAQNEGAPLVTTEKDRARMLGRVPKHPCSAILTWRIEAAIWDADPLLAALDALPGREG